MLVKSLFPPLPEQEPENVHDFCFRRRAADKQDYTYTIFEGRKQSFRQFRERVQHATTAIGAPISAGGLGLSRESGQMVGLLSPTIPEYSVLFLALMANTIPAVPLSHYATPYELRSLIEQSSITHLFVHPQFLDLALDAARAVGLLEEHIYVFGGEVLGRQSLSTMIDTVVARQTPAVKPRSVDKNTIAYLLFSSGTTGLPKAVVVPHYAICSSMLQAEQIQKHTAPIPPPPAQHPIFLTFLPMHHTYGLSYTAMRSILTPVTLVYLPQWDADAALNAIEKYHVTAFNVVPSMIRTLLERQKVRKADLSSLLSIGAGAAYLPPELEAQLGSVKKQMKISQGYGMSEAVITIAVVPSTGFLFGKPLAVPRGTVGILYPGMEARIICDDGREANVNEPGELYIRGPNIVSGYWRNEEATRSTFLSDGWLRTGDRFRIDEHGYFFFEDRVKDTLKISGMQVSPTEIEGVLLEQPDALIVDCAVAGVSGGRTSDEKIPRAWVILSPEGAERGKQNVISALSKWVEERLSKYKHLRGGIGIVDEIPRNPTGKVLRRVLTDQYEAQKEIRARL